MTAMPNNSQAMSESDYLAMEAISSVKHEFFQGEVFAMAGASEGHVLICNALNAHLYMTLLERPCKVYNSDMRVKVEASRLYTYPDVSVVYGEVLFLDERRSTLLNPTVLFEVLSPSTENYDRGVKWLHYQTITSLQAYVLVSQEQVRVETYQRQGQKWLYESLASQTATLSLASINCDLSIAAIYRQIDLDTQEDELGSP